MQETRQDMVMSCRTSVFLPDILIIMQTLSQLREEFETRVRAYCPPREPRGLYDPVTYILQLGGKRVRPLLCACGYLFGAEDMREEAWLGALAVEVFHNFSLLHDDIMDEAPLRRGFATVHQKWNIPTAILSGDVMLIQVYHLLARAGATRDLPHIMDRFHETAVGVCEGQQLDMDFERTDQVGWTAYLDMIRGKTAVLLGGSLELGALLAGWPHDDALTLYRIGEQLGMSFQLKDDWLDVFGEPGKTGKRQGGDILRGKKTALVHVAMEGAGSSDRVFLADWYHPDHSLRKEQDIERIIAIFDRTGAGGTVLARASAYEEEAMRLLAGIESRGPGKACLQQMIRELQGRDG